MVDEPVVLVRLHKTMLVVFYASAWPIRGAELISRHRSWGGAAEARQRLQGAKKTSRSRVAASDEQQQSF